MFPVMTPFLVGPSTFCHVPRYVRASFAPLVISKGTDVLRSKKSCSSVQIVLLDFRKENVADC